MENERVEFDRDLNQMRERCFLLKILWNGGWRV